MPKSVARSPPKLSCRPESTPERSTSGEVSRIGFTANNTDIFKLAGASTFGLLAAFSWGVTPILIKKGLESLPSPVVGVTLSMTCAGLVYAIILSIRGRLSPIFTNLSQPGGLWQIVAGATVGLGTLCRWTALSFTTAAIVTTLSRGSLLVTVGLGNKLLGNDLEPINKRVVWGAISIVIGATIVVLFGRP